jgi:hypothetical protein
MPLQNRVTPHGEIVAAEGRGLLMGNRGILHDADRRIVRYAQGRRWIACLTSFRGRRRVVMSPGSYTELFFLDEAVALAAGHRPCAECRRDDYERFRAAWRRGVDGPEPTADVMDHRLHADRLAAPRVTSWSPRAPGPQPRSALRLPQHWSPRAPGPQPRSALQLRQRTYRARVSELPAGAYVDADGGAWLLTEDAMLAWSAAGYVERRGHPDGDVTVMTPRCMIDVIRAGYQPLLHPSASLTPLGPSR